MEGMRRDPGSLARFREIHVDAPWLDTRTNGLREYETVRVPTKVVGPNPTGASELLILQLTVLVTLQGSHEELGEHDGPLTGIGLGALKNRAPSLLRPNHMPTHCQSARFKVD